MSFASLGLSELLLAQTSRQGYAAPTPIQVSAIPAVLAGGDVIGLAQTGTGKTAAFVLPILQRLMGRPRSGIRALIVTPTRELAAQIQTSIEALGAGTGLRSATVYGGVSMAPQERALRAGVDIIVACPGRLLDHIDRGYVRLHGLETLVLDEADRLLDMGFLPAIARIIKHLPANRQTLLFSATMGPEIAALAARTTRDATTLRTDPARPATTVTHAIYPVPQAEKTPMLLTLLQRTGAGSALVFTRTKHRANRVAAQLERAGFRAARLHSNRSQQQRQAALDGFRDGTFQVLVATDIAARGIDVSRIAHVINYDVPDTPEAYIHRIGRTGRAARTGDASTLATPEDMALVRTIERALGAPIARMSAEGHSLPAAALPPAQHPAPDRRRFDSAPRDGGHRAARPRHQGGGRQDREGRRRNAA